MSFGNFVPNHCFLLKSVSAVGPSGCEEEKQEILPSIFSKGMFDASNSLFGMPLGFSACIFCEIGLLVDGLPAICLLQMQEDIEKELSKVSRASRGPGLSRHIMV